MIRYFFRLDHDGLHLGALARMSDVAADRAGLIEPTDIRGDLQCHTTLSDGRNTLEEMVALMAEHQKLMQEGMSMMGGMGPGGMGGMGMGGAPGATSPADVAARQQMMEKRMEMMQSTMQMMMDRLPPPAVGQ